MMVWVASGGEALPLFHRETVGRDTLTMFATSEFLRPPRCSRPSRIRATALSISSLASPGQLARGSSVAAAHEIWNARAPTSRRGSPKRHAFYQGGDLLFRESASLSGCRYQAWPLAELAGLRVQGERPEIY